MPRRSAGPGDLVHPSWATLGHDVPRAAHPSRPSRPPFPVYLPRSTADVARAVRESDQLGRHLVVRGPGHAGDDLVPSVGGALLLTAAMDRVLDVDVDAQEVTVQPGVVVWALDGVLAANGLGLAAAADHHAGTVAGPSNALSTGRFAEAVLGVEYVDSHGDVHRVTGRTDVHRVLGALGRRGILTEVRLRTVPAVKRPTVLRNRRRRYAGFDVFLADAQQLFVDPGQARLAWGSWTDLPQGHGLVFGTLSAYEPIEAARRAEHAVGQARAAAAFGGLRALGRLSGRLPGPLATAAGQVAAGLVAEPRYARHGDVQRFADDVVGWVTAGRCEALSVLAPVEALPDVFAGMYAAARTARLRDGGVTLVAFRIAGLLSPDVPGDQAGGAPAGGYVDVLMALGIDDARLSRATLDRLVHAVDDVCRRHGAHRYLRTPTSPRTAGQASRLDPSRRGEPAPGNVWEVPA